MTNEKFYFDKVEIKEGKNPNGLMKMVLVAKDVLKIFVKDNKDIAETSYILAKKDTPFPETLEWDIDNKSADNKFGDVTFYVEMFDKDENVLKSFWLRIYPREHNEVLIRMVPKTTEKIVITCFHENIIGKNAIITITSKN